MLVGGVLVGLGLAGDARADEVKRCIAASEAGQVAQRRGALLEARKELLACAQESCPRIVQKNCAGWLDEVERHLPSVVLAAVAGDERDVPGARVEVDGTPVPVGRATSIDPGEHTVVVTAAGFERAETTFTAHEGEKARLFKVRLAPVPAPVFPPPARAPTRGLSPVTWMTAGAAVVGLGLFVGFGIKGRMDASDLRSTCAPGCTEEQRSDVRTTYLVADVGLLAALVLGATSVASVVLRKPNP